MGRRAEGPASDGSSGDIRLVGCARLPGVTHGGVQIGHVQGPRGGQHAGGDAVTARDHEIVAGQVERLGGQGKQRQQTAKPPAQEGSARQSIDEGRRHAVTSQRRRHAITLVAKSEEVGARVKRAERFENAFASSHRNQPVVNDGNAPRHQPVYASTARFGHAGANGAYPPPAVTVRFSPGSF